MKRPAQASLPDLSDINEVVEVPGEAAKSLK